MANLAGILIFIAVVAIALARMLDPHGFGGDNASST